jgi:hypothetical protein
MYEKDKFFIYRTMAPSSCLGIIPWDFILIDPNINNILEVEIKFKILDEQTMWPAGLHEVKTQRIQATVGYVFTGLNGTTE